MRKDYHRIPIIEQEGRNLEEKESRQDLDKKLMEDRESKNAGAED
ncbi:MAG: hypothetical protein ACOX77_01875 [Caldicoprobacterales bacterium]|jgi:hypothetical protein